MAVPSATPPPPGASPPAAPEAAPSPATPPAAAAKPALPPLPPLASAMAPAPPTPTRAPAVTTKSAPPAATRTEELARLRDLLVGPERDSVARIESRLDDPGRRAREVSEVLVEAIAQRNSRDNTLNRSLVPLIQSTFETTAREHPRQFATVLFPVILPAFGLALKSGVARLAEAVDGCLARNFTPSGLRARAAASRAGLPLREHLLRERLVFRVEHLLLAHLRDGVVIHHLTPDGALPEKPETVAALTAVAEQASRDVFRTPVPGEPEVVTTGPLTIWIERGRHCLIAAAIRGTPPDSYRDILRGALTGVEARFSSELRVFSGESGPLDAARPMLREAFRQELREAVTPALLRRPLVLAVLSALLIGAGLLWTVTRLAERTRWQQFLAVLDKEPGLVVTTAERRDGHYFVRGLRDPLARDPAALLTTAQLATNAVNMHWDTFQSGDPTFILDRARRLLQPAPEVTLSLEDNVLVAAGSAPQSWISQARRLARGIPGVIDYVDNKVVNLDRQELDAVGIKLEGIFLTFAEGVDVAPQQDANLRSCLDLIGRITALARRAGASTTFEITGYADPGDLTAANAGLGRTRAELVRNYLAERLPPDTQFRIVDGSAAFARDPAQRDVALTRCVVFRALITDNPAP